MSWNILRSEPNREGTAAAFLLRWGFERYVPLRQISQRLRRSRARQFSSRPIFPQYVFVREGHDRWGDLLEAPGVTGFLRSGENPAILSDEAIAEIRGLEVRLATEPGVSRPFAVGDMVRYVRKYYPFDGMTGVLQRLDKRDRAVVEMILPGRAVEVSTSAQWLRAV